MGVNPVFFECDSKLILFLYKKCFDQCWSQVSKLEERTIWRFRLWKASTTLKIIWQFVTADSDLQKRLHMVGDLRITDFQISGEWIHSNYIILKALVFLTQSEIRIKCEVFAVSLGWTKCQFFRVSLDSFRNCLSLHFGSTSSDSQNAQK